MLAIYGFAAYLCIGCHRSSTLAPNLSCLGGVGEVTCLSTVLQRCARRAWFALALGLIAGASAAQSPDIPFGAEFLPAPAEGGARRWQVTAADGVAVRAAADMDADTVDMLKTGAVLTNLGCAKTSDGIWCKVRPFRGGVSGFAEARFLSPAQGADGLVPVGFDDSKRRAKRRDFDREGRIPCAQEKGQALGTCRAGVADSGGGDATVLATFPNGFSRLLYFVHGEFVSANPTMSGAGRDTDWRADGRVHYVRVDDQRYELTEALLFGN